MRKNQKYSKEEMYLAIGKWQKSGLTQHQFCKGEKLAKATFSYWLKKYRQEQGQSRSSSSQKPVKAFIPVELSKTLELASSESRQIQITYPNGIRLSCPVDVAMQQLKTLINI